MANLMQWREIEATTASPTVTKRVAAGRGASLVRLDIKAGTHADRHSHAYEQFVQVLSGSGSLETAEGVKRFSADSLFYFAPGVWHAAHFDEDTILVETNLTT